MRSRVCKQLLVFSVCLLVLLVAHDVAQGCSCRARPTVLDSYDSSDVVIIARLLSVEKAENTDDHSYVNGVRSATMVVEKVFKGNLKVRDEVIFGQGGGADCIWTFNEEWIGDQFLFYVDTPKKNAESGFPGFREPDWWYAVTCGRSNGVEGATEDLLYLENMSKLRGKTRISGSLDGDWRNPNMEVENKLIKIIGSKKTWQVKTDAHGVFEIYDLPPGKYLIEPEMPAGWKIDTYWLRYSESVEQSEDYDPTKIRRRVPIVLEAKKHASVDIHFEIENFVRGSVMDADGKPMASVCVYLWGRDQKEGLGSGDCTDEKGQFEITGIPAGEYVIVANGDGKLSAREPFRTLYYPNVTERERAAIITVGPGSTTENINIVVPKLEETLVLEGVLKYSDGKPVAGGRIEFKAEKMEAIDGDSRDETDSNGRFSVHVLKGMKGQLSAEDWFYVGEYLDCPKLENLIKQGGKESLTIKTNVISIVADQNLYNLELTFPFPRCEKAKH